MALIPCKECGKEVSSKARTCPHCGRPLKRFRIGRLIPAVIYIALVGFIVYRFLLPVLKQALHRMETMSRK